MIKYWEYLREYRKLKHKILSSVNKVFESGTLIFGQELEKFEKNFCKFNNSKYGLGVGSGTDALFIALKTFGIGTGDEVITVSNTAIPTVAAIKNTGAEVKFVDIGKDFLIDVKKIKHAINSKTKVIIPVHLFGQTCAMDEILSLSKKYNLPVANAFHAGDGNLHPLIMYDANEKNSLEKTEKFGADILKYCVKVGGVLTGEHGVGVEKRELMCEMFNNNDIQQQIKIKKALDGSSLLNPGKVYPILRKCAEEGRMHVHRGKTKFSDLPRF